MVDLQEGESVLKVVPKPEVSSYLYSYNVTYLLARVKYNNLNKPQWVNLYLQNRKIWSCNISYFAKNFERYYKQANN